MCYPRLQFRVELVRTACEALRDFVVGQCRMIDAELRDRTVEQRVRVLILRRPQPIVRRVAYIRWFQFQSFLGGDQLAIESILATPFSPSMVTTT